MVFDIISHEVVISLKKRRYKPLLISIAVLIIAVATFCVFVWNGIFILNDVSAGKYSIRGVDVSSYQGEIDWETLSSNNISFAFIKATEGSSFVDKHFDYNYKEAQKTELAIGAYHFFSYDSSGQTQAENFINTVVPFEGMLPPVIDLEFYGDKEKNPPNREAVSTELKAMLDLLEEYYGLKPIIYVTEKSYRLYLSEDYEEYDIWIRYIITDPTLSDGRMWTFWQYTNRERLDGYNGREKYIDVNVFDGSEEDFLKYPRYESKIDPS